MDFTILGPVSAKRDGAEVALDGSKQRTVLAALLLADGRVLPDERLTTLLWGWDPPATSTNQLYTYVSRLRTRVGPGPRLERHGLGYRLDIGDARFDWARFRPLAEAGRTALADGRYEDADRLLTEALALWRGPALSGATAYLAEREAHHLEEARLSALENQAEAALALGRHHDAVPELTRLVSGYPVRERLRGQLMTALFRCGRQADALAAYEEGRRVLADDLGIDPGSALRDLHQSILTSTLPGAPAVERARAVTTDTTGTTGTTEAGATAGLALGGTAPLGPLRAVSPAAQAADPSATASAAPVHRLPVNGWQQSGPLPALLPAAPADFTGRDTESDAIRSALADGRGVVILGAPGTGASALALRAAHLARTDFPDGQLYADLRTPDGAPRDPAEVLGWFLRALGADPARLPAPLEERAQLYRTLLSGRRMAVVLDNAADDVQVRPLLPGCGQVRTLVTGGGDRLALLEGTRLIRIGPLAPDEARGMLAAVAGAQRVAAEPEATARVAELCDRLPLALRIAAARLAAHPQWPIARLAARLAPEHRRLRELRLGSFDVRATLARTLRPLDASTRSTLRALALVESPYLTAPSVADSLGMTIDDAEEVLERLLDARLLESDGVGADSDSIDSWPGYRFTPLVRLFAREQSPLLAAA
ncbi:AfsR/SARP family transcriptional regulator [Streptomyces apocyni]|uniref:AfsR/SARP family transcriptional regulator n=1 Tax=Streptomyces apocyni TaxID=2654677 RepID=UPI0012E9DDA2|nr:AfsR/SARP family transcriptional regulator [Streptomyces apocyni]